MSSRTLRRHLGADVIVNLCDGDERALRGTLHAVTRDDVTLREVTVLPVKGGSQLDGLAVIPLANVSWVQVI